MNYRELAAKLLDLARVEFDDAEVFLESNTMIKIDYYNTDLNSYQISDDGGISLKVRQGEAWASTYSEKISEDAFDQLLEGVRQILEIAEPNPHRSFYKPEEGEVLLPLPERNIAESDTELMLQKAEAMARATLDKSEHVQMVSSAIISRTSSTLIMNTLGLDRYLKDATTYATNYVVLNQEGEMKSDFAFRLVEDLGVLPVEELADEALAKAYAAYGAKSVKPGTYKIVLERDVFSALISAFISAFSADMVQKGMSLLANKRGEKIASDVFTLVDDPLLAEGLVQRNFDGEGVPAKPLYLIKDGVLENYLYDLQTASKDNMQSTGNSERNYKNEGSPGTTNLKLEVGTKSFDQLLEYVGEGLLITDLQGLHSGLDPVSGDFSLPANGFVIEEGKKSRPVNQITIAGNLKDLLFNIEEVGRDQELTLYDAYFPSVVIKDISVSGEA